MKRDTVSHIALSLLGSIPCLCLLTMTFYLPTGLLLWIFTGVTAVAAPVLAGRSRRIRLTVLGLWGALCLALVLIHFTETKEGIGSLIRAVVNQYELVYTGEGPGVFWSAEADYALLLPFVGVAAAVGLWIGGPNRRWLPPVILTAALFALCVAVSSLTDLPEKLAVVSLTCFWLTLVLTGHLRRFRSNGGKTALALLPLVLLLTVGVLLAVDPEGWTRTASQERVVAVFQQDWNRLLEFFGFRLPPYGSGNPLPVEQGGSTAPTVSPDPGTVSGLWSDRDRHGFDLHTVGPRYDTGDTVLRIFPSESGPLYLRGYSLGDYDPVEGWKSPFLFDTYQDGREGSSEDVRALSSALMLTDSTNQSTLEVLKMSMDSDTALLPYHASPVVFNVSDTVPQALEGDDTRSYTRLENYRVQYSNYQGDYSEFAENLPDNAVQYTNFVNARYLTLPDLFRDQPVLQRQLEEWGIGVPAGGGPLPNVQRLEIAQRIARGLADQSEYDKTVSPVPAAEDFVTYFLTESRRGYCIHFATAGTLLCRAAGIPARYVSGFYAEVPTPRRWFNVTDERAHAWVEIYLEGFGWVPVEMTPAAPEPAAPVVTTRPSVTLPSTPSTTAVEDPTGTPTTAPGGNAPGGEKRSRGWILWAAGIALLLALIPLQREWRLAHRRRRFREQDLNRSTLYAWHIARRTEKYGGVIPERLRDLAEKARFSREGVGPEERQEAVDLTLLLTKETYASLSRPKKLAMGLWSALV